MFMRFLQLKIRATEIQGLIRLYEDRIVPSLESAQGCLGAYLVQSALNQEEVLSLTLWRSENDSSSYERSGLYMRLVGSARPFFAEAHEWRLVLSKDLTLEYGQEAPEPTVETFSVSTASGGALPTSHEHGETFMRIVSLHHKPGMLDEYRELYQREIIPTLLATHGCQFACLSIPTTDSNESISVTLWNKRSDADEYERQGIFRSLLEKVRHTLSDLSQLQMQSRGTRLPSTTSDDVAVEGFHLVSGRTFHS